MLKYYIIPLLLLFSIASSAQKGSVKGKLIDSVGRQALKDASITVVEAQDSTLEAFGLSQSDGSFEVRNISQGKFIVNITFEGYRTVHKRLIISRDKLVVDLGEIIMKTKTKEFEEVIVTESPMKIKNDTIEYNAGSFKTKPNAVVEDLLKKLPGVEVAKDGTVTAQGEKVQRVLVDGKRFFGDDPKMATRNLPPDVVDKIQVYDAQSDQSTFSGFDDGTRTKTINITTKKDKRRGVFGKAMAGGGNEGRYESSLNLNSFKNDQQLSLVAEGNDVNRQAFSVQDILGVVRNGGGGRGGSGGANIVDGYGGGNSSNGITTVWAGGLNYRDVWGKKTDAYGSYFYNNVAVNNSSNSLTQRFNTLGDSSQYAIQNSTSLNKNQGHRFNYNIEWPVDSSNSFVIRPNGAYQQSTVGTLTGTNTTLGKATELSKINQQYNSDNNGYNGNVDVLFRHRFKKKGHTLSLDLNGGGNSNDGTATNQALDTLYPSGLPFARNVYQDNSSSSHSGNGSATGSYTFPIAKNQMIELSTNYSYNQSISGKNTYAYDSANKKYDLPVDSLTNNFKNTNYSDRATVGYRIQNSKFNLGITSGVQFSTINSLNRTNDSVFEKHYTNLYPTANFVYNFSRTKNIRINYNGRTNAPSLSQLQPVLNNSNQTNVIVGNADLKQSFVNSIRIFFTSFDVFKLRNIFAVINASQTSNGIVSSITQYNTGVKAGTQRTTYVNRTGGYNISGFFTYGFQLDKPKSNLNFTTNLSNSRNLSIINDATNYTYNSSVGETIGWNMNLNEKFDMNFHTTSTYNIVKNTIQAQSNSNYFTQSFWIEPTYTFNGGWVFSNDFSYSYSSGRTAGYNTSVPLWNAYISKLMFKQRGELKIALYDIMNKNVSVTRTTTNNSVTDLQSNVLKQYYSLTFSYNLRKFATKQPSTPSMFRGMRGGDGGGRGRGGEE